MRLFFLQKVDELEREKEDPKKKFSKDDELSKLKKEISGLDFQWPHFADVYDDNQYARSHIFPLLFSILFLSLTSFFFSFLFYFSQIQIF